MLCTCKFNRSCYRCDSVFHGVMSDYEIGGNWTMVVGCTLITNLEFDMFSTIIVNILEGTLGSVLLSLPFFIESTLP